jgi:hypothetical protein
MNEHPRTEKLPAKYISRKNGKNNGLPIDIFDEYISSMY